MKMKKVVVIGGGTGTTAVLSALKRNKNLEISVIVSMMDDGGSNAVIRDEFGLLPLSDLRKSIIALSEVGNGVLRKLFVYRFSQGQGLSGHTLGNLMMTALSHITGSEMGAIEALKKLFRVRGNVVPVTLRHTELFAEYETGQKVKGEHLIDEPEIPELGRIKKLSIVPKASANPEALKLIKEADFIIAGPGDLYTTTLANLVVSGMKQAISKSNAVFIFISNLMTKHGQTTGMNAGDLALEITRYAGRKPDVVLVHRGNFDPRILKKYHRQKEYPIENVFPEDLKKKIVVADLVGSEVKKDKGDSLKRSLIRHDSVKLGKVLLKIFNQYGKNRNGGGLQTNGDGGFLRPSARQESARSRVRAGRPLHILPE